MFVASGGVRLAVHTGASPASSRGRPGGVWVSRVGAAPAALRLRAAASGSDQNGKGDAGKGAPRRSPFENMDWSKAPPVAKSSASPSAGTPPPQGTAAGSAAADRRTPFDGVTDEPLPGGSASRFAAEDEKLRALLDAQRRSESPPEKIDSRGEAGPASTTTSSAETEEDLSGDGGVLRRTLQAAPADAAAAVAGSRVRVHYVGRLAATGAQFDSSRDRNAPFEFVVGEGRVIRAWDVALVGMRVGQVVRLTCAPSYAYGLRGVPPVIPPKATLVFDVELLEVQGGQGKERKGAAGVPAMDTAIEALTDDGPVDLDEMAHEYWKTRAAEKAQGKQRAKWYFISPFASQTGERPPWWLNPNITFVLVFLIIGAATYIVYISGGIHQGFPSGAGAGGGQEAPAAASNQRP
ncbi:hypothetical protein CDCA_CDCA19G4691 [Cyanidium caldarium]|uniref:peptidylprolyl isomerase n=1 Tax=Cyanidium caldarium TaxID=2771 RepID=A0AAV9J2M1_CYACA|nr:hypothetical protein CDCA_CDCA19G4691 [Cyanidium caldarium]